MSTRVRIVCEFFPGRRARKRRESKRPRVTGAEVKVIYQWGWWSRAGGGLKNLQPASHGSCPNLDGKRVETFEYDKVSGAGAKRVRRESSHFTATRGQIFRSK
jgi:hypothetical protein